MKCFQMLIQFSETHSGKVFWIAGNHDVPYRDRAKSVEPIIENTTMNDYEDFLEKLPVMACFPGGIKSTHGGWSQHTFPIHPFPGMNITPEQKRILQTSRLCLPTSIPKGSEYDNLPSFCPKDLLSTNHESNNTTSMKLLIRGHDHPMEGYHWVAGSDHPSILTLLGSTQLGVQFMPQLHRKWTTLAKLSKWNKLEVMRLHATGKTSTMIHRIIS